MLEVSVVDSNKGPRFLNQVPTVAVVLRSFGETFKLLGTGLGRRSGYNRVHNKSRRSRRPFSL